MSHRIGVYGMAVMGQNLALNIAEKLAPSGQSVAVCNRSPAKVDDVVTRAKEEGDLPLVGYKDVGVYVPDCILSLDLLDKLGTDVHFCL